MIDPKKVQKAFDDFDALAHPSGAAAAAALPANFDVCGTWHKLLPAVDAAIEALNAIGSLVPIAKRAASVLQTLKNLLNVLCP